MKVKLFAIFSIILFSTFLLFPTVNADEKIDVYGFFTWLEEDGSWHEWVNCSAEVNQDLLHLLSLKIGQPVKCKIILNPHKKCTLTFDLYEPGVTRAFDVIDGSKHEESVAVKKDGTCATGIRKYDLIEPGTKIEYTWILTVNNNWINGNAPLKAYWLGNFYEHQERSGWINFVEAYILNEKWDGPSIDMINDDFSNENINNAPGFELILVVCAIAMIIFWKRKMKS